MTPDQTEAVVDLVEQVRPLFAGRAPHLVGAALADLLAMLLAGHMVPGDRTATHDVRERLLALHIEAVRRLIPINAKIMDAEVTHDEH